MIIMIPIDINAWNGWKIHNLNGSVETAPIVSFYRPNRNRTEVSWRELSRWMDYIRAIMDAAVAIVDLQAATAAGLQQANGQVI